MSVAVLGIDPSLNSTGLALVDSDHGVRLGTSKTQPDKSLPDPATTVAKLARMRTQYLACEGWLWGERDDRFDAEPWPLADLVVIEALSFGSHGSATRDLAGLWWLIIRALDQYDMPLGVVAPGTLKRWATGNGNADKRDIAAAMSQRWPGTTFRNTDEADALALASIGLHHLRVLPWEPEPYQTDSLRRIEWNTADRVPQCE